MPYITDKLKLGNPLLDRRVKMQPCQKEQAKQLHKEGMSINAIARMFKVNKRLIQFILFPERKLKNLEDRKKRGGTMNYYNKDSHTKNMRTHRRYKYAVLTGKNTNGMIKSKSETISEFEKRSQKKILLDKSVKAKSIDLLKDYYVVNMIKGKGNNKLSSEEIKEYPELIEAKRVCLKFKRAIKEKLKNK